MAKEADPFADELKDDPFAEAQGLFDKPAVSFEQLTDDDNLGKLALVFATGIREKVVTRFTPPGAEGSDAVEANAVIFDDEGKAHELFGTLIFPKVIVGQLRGRIGGKPVLGVLAKRKSQEKGRSDAWILDPDQVTAEQVKLAAQYVLANTVDKADAAG